MPQTVNEGLGIENWTPGQMQSAQGVVQRLCTEERFGVSDAIEEASGIIGVPLSDECKKVASMAFSMGGMYYTMQSESDPMAQLMKAMKASRERAGVKPLDDDDD